MNEQPVDFRIDAAVASEVAAAREVVVGAAQDGAMHLSLSGTTLAGATTTEGPTVPLWQAVQPGQAWVLSIADTALDHGLSALGAIVAHVRPGESVSVALLSAVRTQRDRDAARTRELAGDVTVLRRELNRALSALSPRHPILGLMPSATLDELDEARRETTVMRPDGPDALLEWRPNPLEESDRLRSEVTLLEDELRAIQATRLFRWSNIPRQWYRRARRSSGY